MRSPSVLTCLVTSQVIWLVLTEGSWDLESKCAWSDDARNLGSVDDS